MTQLWPWLSAVPAVAVLAWAARRLPWFKLRGDADAQRVLVVAVLVLCAMRWFNADALLGVRLHFLGASIATLMFGARFGLWVMATVSLAAWLGGHAWHGWAADFLLTGAVPVAVTSMVSWLALRRLPAHLMVYVMVNAFLAGGLAMAGSTLGKALVEGMLGAGLHQAYLLATVPLMFAEGFFTGGAMALVVVYRPQWCASFDDAVYLDRSE